MPEPVVSIREYRQRQPNPRIKGWVNRWSFDGDKSTHADHEGPAQREPGGNWCARPVEQERQKTEQERQWAERLVEKPRTLGIDPDSLYASTHV